MLSTENPPPDLCQNSQLKSFSSDEKTCDKNQHLFHLDLSTDDNNPLPNFSIRDYVSKKRAKDIKNNWPFSQKNLQLCLKHGVKDVLPPFQSLDSVRNQTTVEENLRDSDEKVSELSVLEKLTVDLEKEFPSTVTTQACSDINSILPTTSPCSEPGAVILPAFPIEKPELAVRGSNKVESNIQCPGKKCRLIVKLNNISEPKPHEDLAVNTPVVSETMASKVCPVCKTFSSSSNTTLNAHIDQCLSDDTPIKRTENPKVIKHRIKPRKTKLLMDVYKTALPCTLEDLDRRNGTTWSPNRGPQPDDLEEACAEEKKMNSSVDTENIDQDDAVYIDSNGTKLRILSKLSHPPSKSNVNNDPGPSKFVKRDVGKKLLPIKKKKHLVQKYKPQKHSLDGQGSCSPDSDHLLDNPHGSNSSYNGLEVDISQQKSFHSEGNKEDDPTQPLVASDQRNSDDFGMIKRWVGSKRTGLKKKTDLVLENQYPDESMKNLRVKSVSSLVDTTLSKGSTSSKSPVSSGENPFAPTEYRKRKDILLCNSQDGIIGPSRLRKRPFPLLASQRSNDKNKQLMFSKFNVKHSSEVPNSTENLSPRCDKQMELSSNPHIQDDSFFIRSNVSQHHGLSSEGKKFAPLRKPSSSHTSSPGNRKFSSLRTKLLSVRHASVAESKKNSGRKLLNIKNTRLHCASESDEEEAFVSRSAHHRQNSMVETLGGRAILPEKDSGQPPINRTRVLKIRKKVGRVWNTGEGDTTSNDSDSHSGGKNVPVDTSNVVEEEADEMMDEFASGPTYGMTDGEAFASFSKSLDSAYPGIADSSNIECGSHYYNGHCSDELVLNGDQDNVGAEMDADEAQGNYFVDVDPIPIPGPPGSFLPSPGRMESEDLQGHSSLTTCRLQSSEEGHGVVDMDSSDSPVSGISGVSNSIVGRSNSISINNLSHSQHDTQCDISVSGSGQVASEDRELNLLESRPDLMSPEMTHEARNIQLCCCARKDGILQGTSLNYQDSQILRRRTMTSAADAPKNEIHCLNTGPGTLYGKVLTPEPEKHAANLYPPSPSTPNPVLRLMGKNLMVVNKDDNSSPRIMPIQSSTEIIDHPILRPCAENGQNELNSFQHNLSQGPSTFDNLQQHIPVQHFEFNSSGGFKIPANHELSTPMYPGRNFAGNVASRCLGLAYGVNRITDQLGSKVRLDSRTVYGGERVGTDSSGGKHKDVIVIDDSAETEAGGSAAPSLALHNNPFYSYNSRVYPQFNGSPVVLNGNNTIMPPGMAGNLGNWNIPEGNSKSSTAPLPSTVHLRSSSVYFSPGFHERE